MAILTLALAGSRSLILAAASAAILARLLTFERALTLALFPALEFGFAALMSVLRRAGLLRLLLLGLMWCWFSRGSENGGFRRCGIGSGWP